MDSFTQVAAYLQPTLEYAAKIGSIVSLWMLLVATDKHLLGLPIFKGSLWHSPRIPPRFAIKGRCGGKDASSSHLNEKSTGNGSDGPVPEEVAPFGSSPIERGFAEFTTTSHQPLHPSHPSDDFLSLSASGSSALSIYQPLEVHDPFNRSSQWLQPGFVGYAVLLVLVLAFLRWFLFGKNEPTQARKTSDIDTSSNDALGLASSPSSIHATSVATAPTSSVILIPAPLNPPQASSPPSDVDVDMASSPPSVQATSIVTAPTSSMTLVRTPTESAQGTRKEAGGVGEAIDSVEDDVVVLKKEEDHNNGHKEIEDKDDNEQRETEVIATAAKEERKDLNDGSKKNGDEAENGDGKEELEKGRTDIIGEEGLSNPGDFPENEGLDEVAAVAEAKPKKKRIRQNAKRREAKRVLAEAARQVEEDQRPEEAPLAEESRLAQEPRRAAEARKAEEARQEEEARTEAGEAHNAFPQDTKECEEKVGKAEEVEPEAGDTPNSGLGGTIETVRKKPRRRQQKRKPKVEYLARNDIDHETDDKAEASQHRLVTERTEKNIECQERSKASSMDKAEVSL